MSHFAVGVILKDLNDLERTLEPYQENNMDDCPKEYLEFTNVYDQCKEEYENSCQKDEKFKIDCPTLEEYIKDYCGYSFDKQMQQYGYWDNPNAKWDYWTICNFNNFARYNDEKMPDGYCKLKDLNVKQDMTKYQEAIKTWELIVENKEPKTKEDKEMITNNIYSKEYYLRFETKEYYAYIQSIPHYWAFIFNGLWYEKGSMGWWGINDATKESADQYLDKWLEIVNNPLYGDYYIVLVDCHI